MSIPDTRDRRTADRVASPNVADGHRQPGRAANDVDLLTWLIGGGLAIIAALLLFGRRSAPEDGVDAGRPQSPETDRGPTDRNRADAVVDDEYDIEDDSPTEENLALDADLVRGTGLETGIDMDVAQDFGFVPTAEVDLELPFEPEAAARPNTRRTSSPPMHAERRVDPRERDPARRR